MEILSGIYKGQQLAYPKDRQLRPSSAKVRAAIANIMKPYLPDSRVLDLCAGTGAVGLELLSNGAQEVVFVDQYTQWVQQNGFTLSEIDLQIRGPGDILGSRQSGLPTLNMADIIHDQEQLVLAQRIVSDIFARDPALQSPSYRHLKAVLQAEHNPLVVDGIH